MKSSSLHLACAAMSAQLMLIALMLLPLNLSAQDHTVNPNDLLNRDFRDENGQSLGNNGKRAFDSLDTDAIQQRFLNGNSASDNFGYSVSGAGDVNGDGYDDVIVGAPFNDANAVDGGRAYIYFGGILFNTVPDVILPGSIASAWLGFSVSSAGDVNGDGYDDVAVGSMGYLSFTGRVYIYYGGSAMNTTADVILTGETAGDEFSRSVDGAGDVNGDGFADVIVGAPGYNSATGRVYIFFGGSAMNNVADVTANGAAASHSFGFAVSSSGDFNGDGFSDVIAGAPSAFSVGRTYLYLGAASMDNVSDLTFAGSGTNSNFGASLCHAFDINGDGFSDIVIGAPGYNSTQGRAYAYFGSSTPNAIIDLTLTGESAGNSYGSSVSSAGDVNGDGYSDILIGASGFASSAGRAYLYRGGPETDNIPDKYFNGENASDNFGSSADYCGDVNGDGYSEFLIGAYQNDVNGSNSGRAYVYFDRMTGSDIPDLTLSEASSSEYGTKADNAGDVNGDGFDDVMVSDPDNASGKVYIYLGGAVMNTVVDVTLSGEEAGNLFGYDMSSAGDVNGDGFGDVIVGAPMHNSFLGRAYIFFGGTVMNNVADVILTGTFASGRLGFVVSSAGDMNADGFADVIVGTPFATNLSKIGNAQIFLGGSAMNNIADVTLEAVTSGDVSYAKELAFGDINGDGYSDVMVSAHNHNTTGGVYIYLGRDVLSSFYDYILTGTEVYFGVVLFASSDLNNDGYDDLLVADDVYDFDGVSKVLIYHGGPYFDNIPDKRLNSPELVNEYYGSYISAGDVNNDGFADVLVGDYAYGGSNYGKAYVYFGGPFSDTVPDVTYTGETAQSLMGGISTAGDINRDGSEDIIIGSRGIDRAFIYLSTPAEVRPIITYYKDVPFDQGGQVLLKWRKSAYDVVNGHVTQYIIERSAPPGTEGFSWQPSGNVTASGNQSYSFTAGTFNDSMSGNSGTTYFRVTSMTSDAQINWRSNIVSAYSVDNLAPFAPQNLSANPSGNSVLLEWDQNLEADLHHYNIYRGLVLIGTGINSDFTDNDTLNNGVYSYQIAAVDIHGNISLLSDTANVVISNSTFLSLKMITEGFYIPGQDMMSISDEVAVVLKSAAPPYSTVDSVTAAVDKVTFTGVFEFQNAPSGNYYIVVRHRNTIETWSSAPVGFTPGGTSNFDLTSSLSQAFGGNMNQVNISPFRAAVYSGDVDQDGTVDATDAGAIDNDAANFTAGYVATDLTGDEIVDASDAALVDNNALNFVSKVTP